MIVDSSALVAILLSEADEKRLKAAIVATPGAISAATLLETSIVLESRIGKRSTIELDELLAQLELRIVPFTAEHAALAREAFRRFGKGRHPARLNFGDCMAYALAKARGEPLLFKGGDFSQTDIQAAAF